MNIFESASHQRLVKPISLCSLSRCSFSISVLISHMMAIFIFNLFFPVTSNVIPLKFSLVSHASPSWPVTKIMNVSNQFHCRPEWVASTAPEYMKLICNNFKYWMKAAHAERGTHGREIEKPKYFSFMWKDGG